MPVIILALAPAWAIYQAKQNNSNNNNQQQQQQQLSHDSDNSAKINSRMFPWWKSKNPKQEFFDLCSRATSKQHAELSVEDFQEQLQCMLQQHPDLIHAVDDTTGKTVLHFVCEMNTSPTTLELVETLISISEAVHDHNADNDDDEVLMVSISSVPRSLPTMAPLLRIPCSHTGELPLHVACQRRRHQDQRQGEDESLYYSLIQNLLTCHPAAVSARDSNGNVPLHSACITSCNSLRVIQLLVDTWKDALWVPNQQGNLPIHLFLKWNRNVKLSSSNPNMAIFHYLVIQQAPSTVNVRNHADHTPYDILACGSLYNPEFHPMGQLLMETEQKLLQHRGDTATKKKKKKRSSDTLQSLALTVSTTSTTSTDEYEDLEKLDGDNTDDDDNDDDSSLQVEVQDEDVGGELSDIENDKEDKSTDNMESRLVSDKEDENDSILVDSDLSSDDENDEYDGVNNSNTDVMVSRSSNHARGKKSVKIISSSFAQKLHNNKLLTTTTTTTTTTAAIEEFTERTWDETVIQEEDEEDEPSEFLEQLLFPSCAIQSELVNKEK